MSAEIATQVRIGWTDTDAAGHHHHASVVRLVEAAEADLYRRIGDPQLMTIVPRVAYHAEYLTRLYYQDLVEVTLRVSAIGRSSLEYAFEVRRVDDGAVASRGGFTVVHIDEATGRSEPWPDHLRKVLEAS